jgi:hypothetical protein
MLVGVAFLESTIERIQGEFSGSLSLSSQPYLQIILQISVFSPLVVPLLTRRPIYPYIEF